MTHAFGDMVKGAAGILHTTGAPAVKAPAAAATMHGLGISPAPVKMDGGDPDHGAMVVMGGDLAAGASGTVTADLKPGRYELLCHMPGHYAAGQHIPFTVN